MSDVNRLKARIKEYFCKVIDEGEEGFMSKEDKNVLTYNKDIQKMIDEELAKEPQECKWIPCSERLPEENVIFCDIEGDIFIGHYNKRCDYWYADFCDDRIKSVVKWMPLPDTYEEN